MTLNNHQNNGWPTSEQKLLLRAALLPGEEVLNSWQQWKTSVDIEDLDTESYRLLPLLYRNLSAQGVTDLHMARLKGVYRRTWSENQVLFHQLTAILSSFQDAGIETLLLKDAALSLHYYEDSGLRMIHNFDIFVNQNDALAAINLLQKIGWMPKGKIPNQLLTFSHTCGFENKSRQHLNLRWHLFADGFPKQAEDDFWNSAILTKVGNLSTHILSPTEQLSYISACQLGNSVLPMSRLADAAVIINSSPLEVDWNRLVAQAQKYRLVLPLKDMLTNLHEILNVPIPLEILQEVQNLPISSFEQSEYQLLTREPISVLERFLMRYFQYSRAVNTDDLKSKFLEFPKYLQYVWGLEHLWQVPSQATLRGIRRIIAPQPKN